MSSFLLDVLVVDDELPLRQELQSLPWRELGANLIGEAGNGAEALELCRELNPDVVVTDISMPIMDGMELIRALKRECPAIQTILLTCHSDFDFAREALKLGALDYLLKITLNEEEIERCLAKARKNIDKERILRNAEREKRRFELAKQFGHPISKGLNNAAEYNVFLSRLEAERPYPFHLVRLKLSCASTDTIFIRQVVTDQLSKLEQEERIAWFPVDQTDYCLYFSHHGMKSLTAIMENLLITLPSIVEQELPFISKESGVCAIMSDRISTRSELVHYFELSKRWEEALFYDGEKGNLFIGEPQPLQSMNEALRSDLANLMMKVEWNRDALTQFFREPFFLWCMQNRIRPDELKNWSAVWRLKWLQDRPVAKEESRLVHRMMNAGSLSEFVSALIYDVEIRNGDERPSRKEIRDAKTLILSRLNAPLTLAHISKEVGLSPQYLSKLFHESAGESFNEFLTKARIQKAVELLQTTNLKVYEIAEQVGIPSYRYFSVLFRKKLGKSPSDYRKSAGV